MHAATPCTAGRDLYRALEIRGQTASGASERVFGWRRRGRRVALDVARALNYLHSKASPHSGAKRRPCSSSCADGKSETLRI